MPSVQTSSLMFGHNRYAHIIGQTDGFARDPALTQTAFQFIGSIPCHKIRLCARSLLGVEHEKPLAVDCVSVDQLRRDV